MGNNTTKWYGNTDSRTSCFYFMHGPENNGSDYLAAQFSLVVRKIMTLTTHRDGNGRRPIQLVASPACDVEMPYIAYRFTSDWAYDQWNDELVKLGGSLGRGVWDPFKDRHCMSNRLMMQRQLETEETR